MNDDEYESRHIRNDEINNEDSNSNSSEGNDDSENFNRYFCGDIPGGFQTINPEIFNIIAEVLANVVSGQMPFNVQNAVGNWIQLVGQAIETYSAQQTYFQSGPGRMYDLRYYNVTNPLCPNNGENQGLSNSSDNTDDNENSGSQSQISELSQIIENLRSEMDKINSRLDKIENKNNNHNL